jgi:hypothetical protein
MRNVGRLEPEQLFTLRDLCVRLGHGNQPSRFGGEQYSLLFGPEKPRHVDPPAPGNEQQNKDKQHDG